MKSKISMLSAILALAFAAPALAAAPCPVPSKAASQMVSKFDEHSRGIVIVSRDGSPESKVDAALFRSKAVEAALSGFLVIERSASGKGMIMSEMSPAELAAFEASGLSADILANKVAVDKASVTVVTPSGVSHREGGFGGVDAAVNYFARM